MLKTALKMSLRNQFDLYSTVQSTVLTTVFLIILCRSADMQRVSRSVSITIPPGLPSSANQKGMPVSVLFVAVLLMINDIIVNPL